MSDPHYLKQELYDRVRTDPEIFDFLQSASLDGLWYWDLEDPEHEWMNEGFWKLFGIDPATKAHKAEEWQDIINPDDLAVSLDNFHKHLADPAHPYDQIVRYRHADGSIVTVRCRGLAIRDESGTPVRMLGAHTDLTAQRKAERGLDAAKLDFDTQLELAKAVGLAKDAFLSTMSHEVKTPLNAISGFFQLLERSELTDRQLVWAQKGREAVANLQQTLDLILDASRLNAPGRSSAQAEPVPLARIVDHAETCLEGGIATSGKALAFGITIDPALPQQVTVDAPALIQILTNLIDNAIKFTAQGDIAVWFAPVEGAPGTMEIGIKDSGIGISAQDQAHVFRAFHQVQSGLDRPYGGSGLGLSICKRLADMIGGTLEVASDGASGTTFTLRLPVVAAV